VLSSEGSKSVKSAEMRGRALCPSALAAKVVSPSPNVRYPLLPAKTLEYGNSKPMSISLASSSPRRKLSNERLAVYLFSGHVT